MRLRDIRRGRVATREQRTLLMGVTFVAAILVVGRAIPVAMRWTNENQRQAAELQSEWHRAASDLGDYPAARDSARLRGLRLGNEMPSLLHGATPAARAAALAELLRDAADVAGVRLGTVDVRVDTAGGTVFAHHRAAADATGDVRGLSTFLSELEANPTRVRVIVLSIVQSEPFATSRQPEALQMTVVIEGLGRRSVSETKSTGDRSKS